MPLFRRGGAEQFLFNRFNGRNSLESIARELAEAGGEDPGAAFAAARVFFLRLVGLRVSVPTNPLP